MLKQRRIRENYRKLEKQNQCKPYKQQKILFKMDIKSRLYVPDNI